jgi:hypothetical protein
MASSDESNDTVRSHISDSDTYSLSSDTSDAPFPTYPSEVSYARERMHILTTLVDLATRIRHIESMLRDTHSV